MINLFNLVRVLYGYVLAHYSLWAKVKCYTYYKSENHLSHDFYLARNTVLVLSECLYIVIGKSKDTKPHCCAKQQEHIYIVQSSHKQTRYKYGNYYDYAAHGGNACLEVVLVEIAQCLRYLLFLEIFDKDTSQPCRQHQRQYNGNQRPERCVCQKSCTRKVALYYPVKNIMQHILRY